VKRLKPTLKSDIEKAIRKHTRFKNARFKTKELKYKPKWVQGHFVSEEVMTIKVLVERRIDGKLMKV